MRANPITTRPGVERPGPMAGPLTAALASRAPLAPGVIDVELDMVDPARLSFRAGQFVSMAVGHRDGTVIRRAYSIASPSDRGERLRIILRIIDGGVASAFFTDLALGTRVEMTGPHGFFVLDDAHAGDVVFAATGTGIAPVMPMLGELAGRAEPGKRIVYWGLRHEGDLFARAEVEDLCRRAGASLLVHLSSPPPSWSGGQGRITRPILDRLPDLDDPVFYLVGNGAMIDEMKRELVARGVERKRRIRTEAFF